MFPGSANEKKTRAETGSSGSAGSGSPGPARSSKEDSSAAGARAAPLLGWTGRSERIRLRLRSGAAPGEPATVHSGQSTETADAPPHRKYGPLFPYLGRAGKTGA
ncbi:hypothetical protein GCM10023192_05680 [Amycolatopsis samaneae]